MSVEVFVTGWRSTADAWAQAHLAPIDKIPALAPEQSKVAQKLGLSEEEYARSSYAGELSRPEMTGKAIQAGRLVEDMARNYLPGAVIERVFLETYRGVERFAGSVGGRQFSIEVDEDLLDDLRRSGTKELQERLERVVKMSLPLAGEHSIAS